MSNWFEDNQNENKPTESVNTPIDSAYAPDNSKETSTDSFTQGSQPESAAIPTDSGVNEPTSTGFSEPAATPPATANGWQSQGGYTYPTPQTWNNTYTPPAAAAPSPIVNNQVQPNSGYTQQGRYDPYGWQPYQQPMQPPMSPMQPPRPPQKKANKTKVAIAALATICAATIITLSVLLAIAVKDDGISISSSSSKSSNATNTSETVNNNAPTLDITDTTDGQVGLSSTEIISKNLNSTVVITSWTNPSSGSFPANTQTDLQESGAATGIIMSADGYIITNWHVVVNETTGEEYARIDVTLYDGTVYENAKIIGADQFTDLAVIKIDAAGLQAAAFGKSSELAMGDRVIALGNSGGLGWSSSQGIVSGIARNVYDETGYDIKCLQIDAAINPGNSGGPLLNAYGKVVGINSAKIVAEGYEGLGFSIPIDEAQIIINDLTKYGYVKGRIMLGIKGSPITTKGYEGFQIQSISSDSVLANTAATAGDIITYLNDVRVTTYAELRAELSKHSAGEQITLTLIHYNNRTKEVSNVKVTCTLVESKS